MQLVILLLFTMIINTCTYKKTIKSVLCLHACIWSFKLVPEHHFILCFYNCGHMIQKCLFPMQITHRKILVHDHILMIHMSLTLNFGTDFNSVQYLLFIF